jgi:hypothetical protein
MSVESSSGRGWNLNAQSFDSPIGQSKMLNIANVRSTNRQRLQGTRSDATSVHVRILGRARDLLAVSLERRNRGQKNNQTSLDHQLRPPINRRTFWARLALVAQVLTEPAPHNIAVQKVRLSAECGFKARLGCRRPSGSRVHRDSVTVKGLVVYHVIECVTIATASTSVFERRGDGGHAKWLVYRGFVPASERSDMFIKAKRIYRVIAAAILGLGMVQQAYATNCQKNIGCASCSSTCKDGETCCPDCTCSSCACQCKTGSCNS